MFSFVGIVVVVYSIFIYFVLLFPVLHKMILFLHTETINKETDSDWLIYPGYRPILHEHSWV